MFQRRASVDAARPRQLECHHFVGGNAKRKHIDALIGLPAPHDFRRVPPGAYAAVSFWLGSLLFASEHGPFWEVGLIAGMAYNWWMIRTKSLADCILTHAVTNGALSVYVLAADQWQYWL